jgi:branched-chain amino acid transport system ATP-binding protein
MTEVLKIENLHCSYGPIKAIKGIDLTLQQGETVAVVGANGAGKTTLLKTVSQVLKKTQGNLFFQGEPLHSQTSHDLAKKGLVLVPEGRGTIAKLTVYENLLIAFEAKRQKSGTARKWEDALSEVYSYFPRLKERSRQMAGNLSGGEQQMLAIGKALVIRPTLLMLDEPSLGLSPLFVKEIFQIIQHLREEGISILLIEQNARLALQASDRAYVLSNGKVVMEGTGKELLENDQMLSAYLGG